MTLQPNFSVNGAIVPTRVHTILISMIPSGPYVIDGPHEDMGVRVRVAGNKPLEVRFARKDVKEIVTG